MCLTQIHKYADCRHTKSSSTIACHSDLSSTGRCLNGGNLPTESILVSSPSYCPSCYLDVERQLCAVSEVEHQELEVDITYLKNLVTLTKEKYDGEVKALESRFVAEREEVIRDGEEGDERDKVARYGREFRRMRDLKERYEELEGELTRWVQEAEDALDRITKARAKVVLDFRVRQGVGGSDAA